MNQALKNKKSTHGLLSLMIADITPEYDSKLQSLFRLSEYEYFRALNDIRPKVFFFENVFGFVYKPHKAAFDLLKERAEEYGYDITYKVVNTANYGVPQIRERFICVGVKKELSKH